MKTFRACVGPSANKVHIRTDGQLLVLCQSTAPARNVSGTVHGDVICVKCVLAMARMTREEIGSHAMNKAEFAACVGLEKIL